ncbi:hypothetical protein BH18VER2_BH18VER2_04330 [soil metagenome]
MHDLIERLRQADLVVGFDVKVTRLVHEHGCRHKELFFHDRFARKQRVYPESSAFVAAKALIACSSSARLCAADTCVRTRAVPCGTTG